MASGTAGTMGTGSEVTYKLANEAYDNTTGVSTAFRIPNFYMVTGVLNPNKLDITLDKGSFTASTQTKYVACLWTDGSARTGGAVWSVANITGAANGTIDAGELLPIIATGAPTAWATVSVNSGAIILDSSGAGLKAVEDGNGDFDAGTTVIDLPIGGKVVFIDNAALAVAGGAPNTAGLGAKLDAAITACGVNAVVNSGLTADSVVTVTLTQNRSYGVGEETTTTPMLTMMNQYLAVVEDGLAADEKFDAVIDTSASPSRTKFESAVVLDKMVVKVVDRNSVATNVAPYTDSTTYVGTYLTTQASNGGAVDDLTLRVIGSNQAIKSSGGALIGATDITSTYDSTNGWWTTTGDVTITGTTTCTYTLTVDGTTAINTRSFTTSVIGKPASSKYFTITYLNAGAAGQWTLNGLQVKVPYIALNQSGYVSFIKIVNNSSLDAAVTADITLWKYSATASIDTLADWAATTKSSVGLGTSKAGSTMTISATDIKNKLLSSASFDLGTDAYHAAMNLVVNAPENEVHITAFQKDTVGRTVIPILYDNGSTTARAWFE